jgi:hypothetical protein
MSRSLKALQKLWSITSLWKGEHSGDFAIYFILQSIPYK